MWRNLKPVSYKHDQSTNVVPRRRYGHAVRHLPSLLGPASDPGQVSTRRSRSRLGLQGTWPHAVRRVDSRWVPLRDSFGYLAPGRFHRDTAQTNMTETLTIVECPRDAWQGLRQIIPTEEKIQYLSSLVSLGFRHIDAVSFVSPKHVPQMGDSEAVMKELSRVITPSGEAPEIIGIIVNAQGLERALSTPGVTTIGYPYSISAYFRRANANMSRAESRDLVQKIQKDTKAAGKQLSVYFSLAFA